MLAAGTRYRSAVEKFKLEAGARLARWGQARKARLPLQESGKWK